MNVNINKKIIYEIIITQTKIFIKKNENIKIIEILDF